jgi:hypothetical protein
MRLISVVASLLCASSAFGATDFFVDGKPVDYTPGSFLDPTITVGGYPVFSAGEPWKIFKVTSSSSGALGDAASINMGSIVLTQGEPDGSAFATMFFTTNLSNSGTNQYWTGSPCGGTHLVAVNKGSGKDDNCMTIDASSYQSGEKFITYFSIRSTHGASGGRRIVLELRLNADMLGFRNTAPSNWTVETVSSNPVKKSFVEKMQKWAEMLQAATQLALSYSKPKDVYAGIPSYRKLLEVPVDLADGTFSQQFVSVVEHERNSQPFRAVAYTKIGIAKTKWAYSDEKESQSDADARALEICNTGRPSSAEPCRLYDMSKLQP